MKTWLLAALLAASQLALAADVPPPPPGADVTPPRLSFVDGKASFWRPGAEDWAPARVNMPLGEGDALYTGERANLEVQVGPRAFVRAAERTQLGFVNIDPDFLQLKVTGGHASLDLRTLPAGHTVELDTPHAVFTMERSGYFRVFVADDATHFITRRGGQATITLADGSAQAISPSEEIVVRANVSPVTYAAPELDAWDRWNYARTDYELEALSARYVSPGVYGVGVLDHWGAWRVVPPYGTVWVPDRVPAGWAPYTAGSWVWDVRFGWTWVDDAPWGWAPFHHGRWVVVNGFWAWAPGPVILRPVYAPALVAFFNVAPGVSVSIGIPGPALGWVALGWGEPLRPWWGRPGFVGVPWWGGWGGPRIVNNVVVERTTVVNVNTIVYQHTKTPRAVVAVSDKHFGSGPVRGARLAPAREQALAHIGDTHPARPVAASRVPERRESIRPPASVASRPVVATRAPREAAAPSARVVAAPKRPDASVPSPRPSFGEKGVERPRPQQPPRFEDVRRAPAAGAPPRRVEQAAAPRALPGKPANDALPRQPQARGKGRSADSKH